jgi:TonB family protein
MHVRIFVALLAFFLISIPSAFAAPPPGSADQAPLPESQLKRIYPTCDSYLSRENAAAQIDGRTVLRFQSSIDGKLGDGVVAHGSGDDILDAAALACAENSGISFDTHNKFITGAIVPAFVQWTHGGHSTLIVGCPFQFISVRLNEEGVAELAIHISKDGTVSSATVTKSSGFQRVDNAALACVSIFRYQPAMRDGVPVETDSRVTLNLKLH